MIGRPEWFTYRKFGWGVAPRTKEGWFYIAAFVALMAMVAGAMSYGLVSETVGGAIFGVIVSVIIIDTLHIMFLLPKVHDERENAHQLVVERNASYAAIGTIMAIIIYQAITFSIEVSKTGQPDAVLPFDWTLGAILIAMVLAKSVTSYYLKGK